MKTTSRISRLLLCAVAYAAMARAEPLFPLQNNGVFPVHYEAFGKFRGIGTENFRYRITDRAELIEAMGAGLYPNGLNTLLEDPDFAAWYVDRPRALNSWDYVNTGDPKTDFYVWAQATDVRPATRLFYVANALAEAGHDEMALKAFHAVLVHFPRDGVPSSDHSFVWYPAEQAISRIETITKHNPEIGYRLIDAQFVATNTEDPDPRAHRFVVSPGRWVPHDPTRRVDLDALAVVARRGGKRVWVDKYENGHWRLFRDGKPMVVRGITYLPTPVGRDISGAANQWMWEDQNNSGRADGPYDSWVDLNRNNRQDEDEPVVGDFELMRRMGVNAIRIYRSVDHDGYDPDEFNKPLMRDMAKTYGIYAVMGDFLGAYTVGSGANWEEGTDYTDREQLGRMRRAVRAYVMDHRDEPYVLMWLLGNENLMPADYTGVNATRTQASAQVQAYLRFVNSVARMIKRLDPTRPVAVGNLELHALEEHARFAPDVDIFGANSYRGEYGFGDLWRRVAETYDRPVLITEYGCDAWHSGREEEDQAMQARYHRGNWRDIALHLGGGPEDGNAIGGMIFEFLDEWWKSPHGPWDVHDTERDAAMAFPDGWSSEEWFGIFSQGDGSDSPFLRQPREAYYLYKRELWGAGE